MIWSLRTEMGCGSLVLFYFLFFLGSKNLSWFTVEKLIRFSASMREMSIEICIDWST